MEESVDGGRLGDLARVHDRGAVADLGDDGEVVGDEDEREIEVRRERDEQLEDLRLHHHVERGRRLVCEEDLRLAGECHGNRRALPHPARELVREAIRPVLGDAHALEQLLRLPAGELALRHRRAGASAPRSASRLSGPG